MREISFFPSTSLSSQNAGAARFTDLVSILIESWRELTILTRNWTKRGQPELSDFSCTILAHATAKSMCLARSALPHHSRLTWPVRSSRFSEACENKKQIAQFRLSPFYSVHSSICLLSAISLGTHGFRSFDISSECAKPKFSELSLQVEVI